MIMSFYKIENSIFYGLKCNFIHSIGPVSKGLGLVLDHFEFFFCSLALLFRQKFQKNY